jgi:hypothetical protein
VDPINSQVEKKISQDSITQISARSMSGLPVVLLNVTVDGAASKIRNSTLVPIASTRLVTTKKPPVSSS